MANDVITVVAIDAPFGWPSVFLESLAAYASAGAWPDPPDVRCTQETMRLRVTDRAVYDETRITPLSVSTDKIGVVAMRCARLLAAYWAHRSEPADRSGRGKIVEVYPAAALVQWGISQRAGVADPGTYKGKTPAAQARCRRIFDAITHAAPWPAVHDKVRVVCTANDDCLDALICALTARACELGYVLPISDHAAAQAEGWIHLPKARSLDAMGPKLA